MKAPATPENETDRLNSLRESGLLEIDSSPAFDRLTRLAKRFFRCRWRWSISLMSIR